MEDPRTAGPPVPEDESHEIEIVEVVGLDEDSPAATVVEDEEEESDDAVEIHIDAVDEGDRVLLVDDLIATGGTAEAAVKLLRRAGAHVVGAAFAIDLPDLGGAKRIAALDVPVSSLVMFDGA